MCNHLECLDNILKVNGHRLVHSNNEMIRHNNEMIRHNTSKSDRVKSPKSLRTSAEIYTRINLQTLAPIKVMLINSEDYSNENDSRKAIGIIMMTVTIMSIEMILR